MDKTELIEIESQKERENATHAIMKAILDSKKKKKQ